MKILLIRHGRAQERTALTTLARRDHARRLTEAGRKDMRRAAKGLRKIAPDLDILATSPLVRARETAEIVERVFGGPAITELAALSPGAAARELLDWLREQHASTVALVGHEPDLSRLAALLLTGEARGFLELKKGAACMLEFESAPAAGAGTLSWSLAPGQLRRLAE
jgi:phosphohistidine phosphatase